MGMRMAEVQEADEKEQSEGEEKEKGGKGEKSGKAEKSSDSDSAGPQVGTRFSAEEIHDNVSEAAKEELERPASELVWSSLASGLLVGFSFLAVAFLTSLVSQEY